MRRALLTACFALWAALAQAQSGSVTVSGNAFLKDGAPWIAEGVTLVGLVAPGDERTPAYKRAAEAFGPELLQEVSAYGADLVRFQVNEDWLDPEGPAHDPAYRGDVLAAVDLARSQGFIVIVSMRGRSPRGIDADDGIADAATQRAWAALVGDIGADKGIMLELFNENDLKRDTSGNWAIWQESMQGVVDAVRNAGAQNVLLLGGLRAGKFLTDVPQIIDPLDEFGYAIHPYFVRMNRDPHQWEANWGSFARSHPVIATEWNALSSRPAQCDENTPGRVQEFFDYLREMRIGLVIWAFDLPGVRQASGELTDFEGHQCGPGTRYGAGEAVQEHFQAY